MPMKKQIKKLAGLAGIVSSIFVSGCTATDMSMLGDLYSMGSGSPNLSYREQQGYALVGALLQTAGQQQHDIDVAREQSDYYNVRCPSCDQVNKYYRASSGQIAKCGNCGARYTLP